MICLRLSFVFVEFKTKGRVLLYSRYILKVEVKFGSDINNRNWLRSKNVQRISFETFSLNFDIQKYLEWIQSDKKVYNRFSYIIRTCALT